MPGLREFRGGAAQLGLGTAITATTLTFTVTGDVAGWPTGSTAPFVIDIDYDVGASEKVLVTSRAGSVFTVAAIGDRGYDNTTAQSHPIGAKIRHVLDAASIQEANQHVNDDTRDDHTQYMNTTRHDATARHSAGSVIPVGAPLASAPADAGATGVSSALSRADHKHPREALGGAPGASAVGDTAAAGSATLNARVDHRHAREAFGAPTGTSIPGDLNVEGTATTPARSDHRHARELALPITPFTHFDSGDQGANPGDTMTLHTHTLTLTSTRRVDLFAAIAVRSATGTQFNFAGNVQIKVDGVVVTGGATRYHSYNKNCVVCPSVGVPVLLAAGTRTVSLVIIVDASSDTAVYFSNRVLNAVVEGQ